MGFKSGFDSSETTSTTVTSETILSASEGLQAGGTAIFSHATSIKASGSISAAGNVSGTADLTANRVSGSARGMTTLGTALFSHATSIKASGSITSATTLSGAGNIAVQSLTVNNANVIGSNLILGGVASLSGAGGINGSSLTIGNFEIVQQGGAVRAKTTVSGASSLAGAKLTINGSDIISQAKSIDNVTTITAAGNVTGAADLTVNRVSGSERGMTTLGTALFSNSTSIMTSGSVTFGSTIKQDNSTYGGVTRYTAAKTNLTLPKPNNTTEWVDTTLEIPANSALRYIFVEKTTPGVNSNGTLHLANIGARFGGVEPSGAQYEAYYGDWDVPGGSSGENGFNLEGAAGDPDYTGHKVIHFPVDGFSQQAVYTFARDLWIKVKAVGDASGGTAPVVSLFVAYDTYDLS